MNTHAPGQRLSAVIRDSARDGTPALIPFLTAGYPSRPAFGEIIEAIAPHAAAIEIGIPFTDPMADGVTIQRTSRIALEQGVTLRWILDELAQLRTRVRVPLVLMGYLNPFLAMGFANLADACAQASIDAIIVPDLPLEETGPLRTTLHSRGIGLVQLVSPVTSRERASRIAAASDGFLYAVTTTGVTGSAVPLEQVRRQLTDLRAISPVPVCAGFGIRRADHVRALAGSADGVIVGSALLQAIEDGTDPVAFLKGLRGTASDRSA